MQRKINDDFNCNISSYHDCTIYTLKIHQLVYYIDIQYDHNHISHYTSQNATTFNVSLSAYCFFFFIKSPYIRIDGPTIIFQCLPLLYGHVFVNDTPPDAPNKNGIVRGWRFRGRPLLRIFKGPPSPTPNNNSHKNREGSKKAREEIHPPLQNPPLAVSGHN